MALISGGARRGEFLVDGGLTTGVPPRSDMLEGKNIRGVLR